MGPGADVSAASLLCVNASERAEAHRNKCKCGPTNANAPDRIRALMLLPTGTDGSRLCVSSVTNRLQRHGSRFIHGRGASHRPFFQSFFCSYPLHSRRWHTPARTATEANDQVWAHTLAQTGPHRTRKNTKRARTRAVSGTGRSRPPRPSAVYTPLSLSLHSCVRRRRASSGSAPSHAPACPLSAPTMICLPPPYQRKGVL